MSTHWVDRTRKSEKLWLSPVTPSSSVVTVGLGAAVVLVLVMMGSVH